MSVKTSALLCLFSLSFSGYSLASQAPNDPIEQYEYAQQLLASNKAEASTETRYWLEQSANQGYLPAQKQLANDFAEGIYGEKNETQALYWLTSIALNDPTDRGFLLANFIQRNQDKVTASQLTEALYQMASQHNPAAEQAYNQLLEQRFNQLRAKQVSQIKSLDKKAEQTQEEKSTTTAKPNVEYSQFLWLIWLAAILIISGLSFLVIKKHKQNRKALEAKEENQNQRMAAKVKELEFTNKQLKRQLEKVFKEFKKSKTQAENHKLSVACAMFGYTPQHIPDLQAIKLRYRQQSKLYHPDTKGSEEEMKRLNHAFKLVSQNVTKQ
ncbi:J domain-containing protein [Vibrio diabolicus]|uniref:J domain-containing protein n=1 Tax=Vibrio diabolicus TaxID=50719 RepID=UPI00211B0054|nr:J domain-containing protein [Vibrio diabolicus]MCG9228948.1 J domain-containing protein [Vibrio diabolicus]MCG9571379.1 J domain-containing protein [Vibrio diabolicus]MCG9591101.1 J domain-containing protein [Vibrio diabolicus]